MQTPPDQQKVKAARHALISAALFFVGLFGMVWYVRYGRGTLSSPASTALQTTPAPTQNAVPETERSTATTNAEWQVILTPEQYKIIREEGTEYPFSSPLDHEKRPGTYVSADCGVPLFRSEQKYDSGTGWPSFWAPISPDVVKLVEDRSIPFSPRVEVRDAKCDGHLGHVFDDGPAPTGKRYCMNGVALRFIPDEPVEPPTPNP